MSYSNRFSLRELFSPLLGRPDLVQLAALCYRDHPVRGLEVLLVTSSSGRWILPKGWPIEGLGSPETALQEAWEEGGVRRGKAAPKALGSFASVKRTDSGLEQPCQTFVYPVKTKEIRDSYPEADRRERKWVSIQAAQDMVTEQGLKDILAAFGAEHRLGG